MTIPQTEIGASFDALALLIRQAEARKADGARTCPTCGHRPADPREEISPTDLDPKEGET